MNKIEEQLKEKSFDAETWLTRDKRKQIYLSDALEICKDLYTKEQVEELLEKQKALIIARCRDEFYPGDNQNLQYLMFRNFIERIPSPLGEKKP